MTTTGTVARAAAVARLHRQRVTGDRRLVFVAAGLPLVIIVLVSVLVHDVQQVPLGVVQYDRGPLAQRLVALLGQSDAVVVRRQPGPAAERDDILRGRLSAAIVIPADFDRSLRDGRAPAVALLGPSGSQAADQARGAVAAAVDVLSAEWNAATAAAAAGHLPLSTALRRAEAVTAAAYASARAHQPAPVSPYSYITAANLVLFVFLVALLSSAGIVEARQLGLLRRILATPTPARAVILGELASAAAVAVTQAIGLLVVGRLLFGVHWGDPVGVALVVLALALVAGGASMVLGTVARSPDHAIAVGVVVGIALGMLGGCMWPLDVVGATMRAVGHVAPQAWAMDAFVRLAYGHSGVAGVLPEVGVLTAMAAALVALAVLRLRAAVTA